MIRLQVGKEKISVKSLRTGALFKTKIIFWKTLPSDLLLFTCLEELRWIPKLHSWAGQERVAAGGWMWAELGEEGRYSLGAAPASLASALKTLGSCEHPTAGQSWGGFGVELYVL